MLFRALKSNLYSARYNIRRKETEYEHMWLCSVVAREASREARGCGFQPYEVRSVAILREKTILTQFSGLGRLEKLVGGLTVVWRLHGE
jgi:hypothetical protein